MLIPTKDVQQLHNRSDKKIELKHRKDINELRQIIEALRVEIKAKDDAQDVILANHEARLVAGGL